MTMLTDDTIKEAIKDFSYVTGEAYHKDLNCVRICYEWLDAQKTTKKISGGWCNRKVYVEHWAHTYVSSSDFEIAMFLHPNIKGNYIKNNISNRLIFPLESRLKKIVHDYDNGYEDSFHSKYKTEETDSQIDCLDLF